MSIDKVFICAELSNKGGLDKIKINTVVASNNGEHPLGSPRMIEDTLTQLRSQYSRRFVVITMIHPIEDDFISGSIAQIAAVQQAAPAVELEHAIAAGAA